jgi:hypothetical protein
MSKVLTILLLVILFPILVSIGLVFLTFKFLGKVIAFPVIMLLYGVMFACGGKSAKGDYEKTLKDLFS